MPFHVKMSFGYLAVLICAVHEMGVSIEFEDAREHFTSFAGADANTRRNDVKILSVIAGEFSFLFQSGKVRQFYICHIL